MDNEKCKLCHYFRLNYIEVEVCKRYPDDRVKHHGDWCGEFRAREDVAEESIPFDADLANSSVPTKRPGRPKKIVEGDK
jgi:hypothetical protein